MADSDGGVYVYACRCGELFPDQVLREQLTLHVLTRHLYAPRSRDAVPGCQEPLFRGQACGAATLRTCATCGLPLCSAHYDGHQAAWHSQVPVERSGE